MIRDIFLFKNSFAVPRPILSIFFTVPRLILSAFLFLVLQGAKVVYRTKELEEQQTLYYKDIYINNTR